MATKTITLKNPISVNGEPRTQLTLNEPTLGALDDVNLDVNTSGNVKLPLGAVSNVVANMADIPVSSAKQIAMSDAYQVAGEVMDFLTSVLPNGE